MARTKTSLAKPHALSGAKGVKSLKKPKAEKRTAEVKKSRRHRPGVAARMEARRNLQRKVKIPFLPKKHWRINMRHMLDDLNQSHTRLSSVFLECSRHATEGISMDIIDKAVRRMGIFKKATLTTENLVDCFEEWAEGKRGLFLSHYYEYCKQDPELSQYRRVQKPNPFAKLINAQESAVQQPRNIKSKEQREYNPLAKAKAGTA